MGNIAVVQIRGTFGASPRIKKSLETLNLGKKHSCTVLEDNKKNRSIFQVVKDYATFGKIKSGTKKKLEKLSKYDEKIVCHLHPPRGGFERGGIKKSFSNRGALGKRDNMDDLIEKMLPFEDSSKSNSKKSNKKGKSKSKKSDKKSKKKKSKSSKKKKSKKSKSNSKKSSKKGKSKSKKKKSKSSKK